MSSTDSNVVVPLRPTTRTVADDVDTWTLEAHAMRDAGVALRERALTLTTSSTVRAAMLEAADGWLACGRLRGAS